MLGMIGVGVKKGILFLEGNVTRDCGLWELDLEKIES